MCFTSEVSPIGREVGLVESILQGKNTVMQGISLAYSQRRPSSLESSLVPDPSVFHFQDDLGSAHTPPTPEKNGKGAKLH